MDAPLNGTEEAELRIDFEAVRDVRLHGILRSAATGRGYEVFEDIAPSSTAPCV